jgi:hypothetical protein
MLNCKINLKIEGMMCVMNLIKINLIIRYLMLSKNIFLNENLGCNKYILLIY